MQFFRRSHLQIVSSAKDYIIRVFACLLVFFGVSTANALDIDLRPSAMVPEERVRQNLSRENLKYIHNLRSLQSTTKVSLVSFQRSARASLILRVELPEGGILEMTRASSTNANHITWNGASKTLKARGTLFDLGKGLHGEITVKGFRYELIPLSNLSSALVETDLSLEPTPLDDTPLPLPTESPPPSHIGTDNPTQEPGLKSEVQHNRVVELMSQEQGDQKTLHVAVGTGAMRPSAEMLE